MKDFKQAAEETKKRLGVDLFFICDKKPGACNGSKSEIIPDYRDGWRLRGEAE